MRTGAGFNAPATPTSPATAGGGANSVWHSPVPYLFGGIAAMLGLITFALLILACSYWKLSGFLEGGESAADGESGGADGVMTGGCEGKPAACYEERIVVIMAGDEKPTFLAMPISSRASTFGEHSSDGKNNNGNSEVNNGDGEVDWKKTEGGGEGNRGNTADTQNLTGNEDQHRPSQEQ